MMTKPTKSGPKGGRKTQQTSSPVKLQDVAAPLETELYAKGPCSGFFLPDPSQPDVQTSTLAFNDCRGEVTLVDCSASAAGGAAEGRVTLPVQEVEGFPVVESIEWISLRPRQLSDAASHTPTIVAAIVVIRVPDDRHNDDDTSDADGGPDMLSNETQSSTRQSRPQTQLQLFRIGYSAAVDGDALIPIQPPSTQFGGGKAADGVVLEVREDGAREVKWSMDGRYVVLDTIIQEDFHDNEDEEWYDDMDSESDHDAENDDDPHKSSSGGHHHRTAGSSDGNDTNSDEDNDDNGDSWEYDIVTIFQFTIHGDGTTGTLKEVAMQKSRSFGNFIHFHHHQQGEGEVVVLALYDRGNHSIELWDPTSNPDEDEDVKALLTHELPAPDPPGEDTSSFDMVPPLPLLEHMTTCGRGGKYIVAIDDELALLMYEVTMATPTASHHTRGGKKHHQGKAAAEPKWELHDLLEDHPLIEMQNTGRSGPIVLQATDVTRDISTTSHTTSSDGDACYLMVTGSFSEECLLFEIRHRRALLMYTLTPDTNEGSAAVAVESAQCSSGGITGFTPALALAAPHRGVVLLVTALDIPSEAGSSSPNNKDDEDEAGLNKPTAKLISICPQRVDESCPPTNLQEQFSSVVKYTDPNTLRYNYHSIVANSAKNPEELLTTEMLRWDEMCDAAGKTRPMSAVCDAARSDVADVPTRDELMAALQVNPRSSPAWRKLAEKLFPGTTIKVNGTEYTKRDCYMKAIQYDSEYDSGEPLSKLRAALNVQTALPPSAPCTVDTYTSVLNAMSQVPPQCPILKKVTQLEMRVWSSATQLLDEQRYYSGIWILNKTAESHWDTLEKAQADIPLTEDKQQKEELVKSRDAARASFIQEMDDLPKPAATEPPVLIEDCFDTSATAVPSVTDTSHPLFPLFQDLEACWERQQGHRVAEQQRMRDNHQLLVLAKDALTASFERFNSPDSVSFGTDLFRDVLPMIAKVVDLNTPPKELAEEERLQELHLAFQEQRKACRVETAREVGVLKKLSRHTEGQRRAVQLVEETKVSDTVETIAEVSGNIATLQRKLRKIEAQIVVARFELEEAEEKPPLKVKLESVEAEEVEIQTELHAALNERARLHQQLLDWQASYFPELEWESQDGPLDGELPHYYIVQCKVCGDDDLRVRDAAQCGCEKHRHWMHRDCFETMILAAVNEPRNELEGEIPCEFCKAENQNGVGCIIPANIVIKFVSKEVAEKYDRHRVGSKVAKGQEETEERVKQELRNANETDRLFHELSDQCNNRCPGTKCRQVFHDYDACCALKCASCKINFCAFCLKSFDNADDTHIHVPRCPANPTPGKLFVLADKYHAYHKRRRQRLVWDRLQGEPAERQIDIWMRLFEKERFPPQGPL